MKIPVSFVGNVAAAGDEVPILAVGPCPAPGAGRKRSVAPRHPGKQSARGQLTKAGVLEALPGVLHIALLADATVPLVDAQG